MSIKHECRDVLLDVRPDCGKVRGQHLDAFLKRRRNGGGGLLIIASNREILSNWRTTLAAYSEQLHIVEQAFMRADDMARHGDVVLLEFGALSDLKEKAQEIMRGSDALILSDSSIIGNPRGRYSRAVQKIIGSFAWKRFLSPNPTPNSILDIWSQIFLLDEGQRLGRSYYGFRAAVCIPEGHPNANRTITWKEKEDAATAVFGLIEDLIIYPGDSLPLSVRTRDLSSLCVR